MKEPELREISAGIQSRSDEELLEMVALGDDYRLDVLELARDELDRRGIKPKEADEFIDSIPKRELRESAHFCNKCRKRTTMEKVPARVALRPRIGPRLGPVNWRCPRCRAVERDCHYYLFFFDVHYIGTYRLKEMPSIWPAPPKILSSRRAKKRRKIRTRRR